MHHLKKNSRLGRGFRQPQRKIQLCGCVIKSSRDAGIQTLPEQTNNHLMSDKGSGGSSIWGEGRGEGRGGGV